MIKNISLILVILLASILSIEPYSRIKSARKIVENQGLKSCAKVYSREFCLSSVCDKDLVGQNNKPRRVRFFNKNLLEYLASQKENVFTTNENTPNTIWTIIKSSGAFVKIQNSNKLILQPNIARDGVETASSNDSIWQDWMIIKKDDDQNTIQILNRFLLRPIALKDVSNVIFVARTIEDKNQDWEMISLK